MHIQHYKLCFINTPQLLIAKWIKSWRVEPGNKANLSAHTTLQTAFYQHGGKMISPSKNYMRSTASVCTIMRPGLCVYISAAGLQGHL